MSIPLHIEVSELADQQIRKEDAWWRQNRSKAPNAIREELERVSSLIAFQPSIGARARNVRLPDVRRIHIERIAIGSPRYIEIVAFWGSRRGTGPPI